MRRSFAGIANGARTEEFKAQKHERPPKGRPPCPGGPGTISRLATAILPDNLPLRQGENRRFRQRRSFGRMCAAPLWWAFQPEGEIMPASQPAVASTTASLPSYLSASQPSLPLTLPRSRASRPRLRGFSNPFLPAEGASPYRLPHEVSERLVAALTPARNREAAFALARFLARFWSTPSRLLTAFPIDRRALANRPDLGLTEAQVRGGIHALETVGFLDRALPERGSAYRAAGPAGELHRKPVLFRFGGEYAPFFTAANKRAAAARGGRERPRPVTSPAPSPRPSPDRGMATTLKSPKNKSEAETKVLMGEVMRRLPESHLQNSALDSA